MPNYRHAEIGYGRKIDNIANEDGLWNDYQRMYPFVTWDNVRAVAKRNLTQKQYYVFVKRGRDGLYYRQLEDDIGISFVSAKERYHLAIKKMRKIFEKYLNYRVYMKGSFKFHVEMERKLIAGEYFDRFEKKKMR